MNMGQIIQCGLSTLLIISLVFFVCLVVILFIPWIDEIKENNRYLKTKKGRRTSRENKII